MHHLRTVLLIVWVASALMACVGGNSDTEDYRLIGRFGVSTEGHHTFSWPQTAMEFRFQGTEASLGISSAQRLRFAVDVGGDTHDLWVASGEQIYSLVRDLPEGEHTVRVTRISEASNGVSAFTTPPKVDGRLVPLLPLPYSRRRLLVFGDSITAGFGVEGANQQCAYAMDTSNSSKTYAAFAAKFLDADVHTIAWSGMGVSRFYGETTPGKPTLIDRYPLTLADDTEHPWNPKDYVPNAIIVNIGTNDFWDGSAGNYEQAMVKLIGLISRDYPAVPVYLIVSPLLEGEVRAKQASILASLSAPHIAVLDLGANDAAAGLGCAYHPNLPNQLMMAVKLFSRLKSDLAW